MKNLALYSLLLLAFLPKAQVNDIFIAQSQFQPTVKDAIKFSDLPEIRDSVKRLDNIRYGIRSVPMFPKYEVSQINPAKMQNEPVQRLYKSLLKLGYGPVYNMPYGEFWLGNTRSRETSAGAHLKHFSSTAHLRDVGYGGFSDNIASVFGKKMYKKHSLSGDFNYERNVVHYYGFDTSLNHISDRSFTRQRYQLIEPKLRVLSHYTDSTHINHDVQLSFYNYTNLNREAENNIRLDAGGSMFLNKEKLNVRFLTDYYNHKQSNDTLNDLIMSINPSFEAGNKKWHADVGLKGTVDHFKGRTRFYFFPQIDVEYDIYEHIIVPYSGINGGLIKNSFRSLSRENPFVDSTLRYVNTNNRYNVFAGLKGNLSSNTSYDTRVSYSQLDSLHYFVINYSGNDLMFNRFSTVYDNTSLLTVSGQLKYQLKEKFNIIAKGNYYLYKPKNFTRAYHRPEYDITLSGIYNLQSKIIVRADLFFMGRQWALTRKLENTSDVYQPVQIKGWADINLEAEYRYSKMLSFFARFNNIASQRYYRWERYPVQRFNFMLGLSFVPF